MKMKKNLIVPDEKILEVIIESIKSKKGKEIVSIDLKAIEKSVCNYFVICHAESTTQVSAIAEEIRQKTKEDLEVSADHVEGLQNSFWILLDYISIVVHVFINDQRHFYQLEDLWADGIITKYED
jgi:ribosome-associated protein